MTPGVGRFRLPFFFSFSYFGELGGNGNNNNQTNSGNSPSLGLRSRTTVSVYSVVVTRHVPSPAPMQVLSYCTGPDSSAVPSDWWASAASRTPPSLLGLPPHRWPHLGPTLRDVILSKHLEIPEEVESPQTYLLDTLGFFPGIHDPPLNRESFPFLIRNFDPFEMFWRE